jgi:hypothetical protein
MIPTDSPASLAILVVGMVACACSATRDETDQAGTRERSQCSVDMSQAISGDAVGPVVVGVSLDSVAQVCRVVQDTILLDDEAIEVRVARVEVGPGAVGVAIDSLGSIMRIVIDTEMFRTGDSLGVGTALTRLLKFEDLRGVEGEGVLYVQTGAHCGLSFRLAYWPGDEEHRSLWDWAALMQLPATEVQQVLVVGCRR